MTRMSAFNNPSKNFIGKKYMKRGNIITDSRKAKVCGVEPEHFATFFRKLIETCQRNKNVLAKFSLILETNYRYKECRNYYMSQIGVTRFISAKCF